MLICLLYSQHGKKQWFLLLASVCTRFSPSNLVNCFFSPRGHILVWTTSMNYRSGQASFKTWLITMTCLKCPFICHLHSVTWSLDCVESALCSVGFFIIMWNCSKRERERERSNHLHITAADNRDTRNCTLILNVIV